MSELYPSGPLLSAHVQLTGDCVFLCRQFCWSRSEIVSVLHFWGCRHMELLTVSRFGTKHLKSMNLSRRRKAQMPCCCCCWLRCAVHARFSDICKVIFVWPAWEVQQRPIKKQHFDCTGASFRKTMRSPVFATLASLSCGLRRGFSNGRSRNAS